MIWSDNTSAPAVLSITVTSACSIIILAPRTGTILNEGAVKTPETLILLPVCGFNFVIPCKVKLSTDNNPFKT